MKRKLKHSNNEILFTTITYGITAVSILLVIYPLWFILIASISDYNAIYAGKVWLLPKDVTFEGYKRIFNDASIWRSYVNTILYTSLGTMISLTLTLTAGYALSRYELKFSKGFMLFFIITMYFSGGLIPTYLLVDSLGMIDTIWAMVIPGCVGVWNLIIARSTYRNLIPEALVDAAEIDGCDYFSLFFRIYLPLSKALIAIMTMFYVVGYWNMYFDALIYLKNESLFPLQLILRRILIQNSASTAMISDAESYLAKQQATELIKYGIIVVSSLPILSLYPFLQKYFTKGTLVGSLKG